MARAKRGFKARRRRKKVLKMAEGFYGGRHRLFRTAKEALDRALVYAYRHRKTRKREFRALWNIRINAACRPLGLNYSKLIHGLKSQGVALNRKILADLAVSEPKDFSQLAALAKPA